jgi:hypothetical protein
VQSKLDEEKSRRKLGRNKRKPELMKMNKN